MHVYKCILFILQTMSENTGYIYGLCPKKKSSTFYVFDPAAQPLFPWRCGHCLSFLTCAIEPIDKEFVCEYKWKWVAVQQFSLFKSVI